MLVGDIYSKTLIELVGEGHKDEFTLDGLEEDMEERNANSSLTKDIIDGKRGEAAKVEQGRAKCLIMCVLSLARPGLSPTGLGGLWAWQPCMQSSVCWLRDVSGCFPESGGMGSGLGTSLPGEEGLEQGSVECTGVCAGEGGGWSSLPAEILCSPP